MSSSAIHRQRSLSLGSLRTRSVRARVSPPRIDAAASPALNAEANVDQGAPVAAAASIGDGFGAFNNTQNSPASTGSPTSVDSDNESMQNEASNGDNNGEPEPNQPAAAAVPVLTIGGKAQHPTLGEVTILAIGALGCRIEFFSGRTASIKERSVLHSDLVPLPDDDLTGLVSCHTYINLH